MANNNLAEARRLYETLLKIRNHIFRKYAEAASSGGVRSICFDLTLPQVHTLCAIGDKREMTVKEVAHSCAVSPPSASAMIDRLVEMGMVEREHSQKDRREVLVRLSPQGAEAVESFEKEITSFFVELMARIGPEWARKWCDVYERLGEVLDEKDGGAGREET